MAQIHTMSPIIGETYHNPSTGDFAKVLGIQTDRAGSVLVHVGHGEYWDATNFLRCYQLKDPSHALAET